jgi:hypothetical protein
MLIGSVQENRRCRIVAHQGQNVDYSLMAEQFHRTGECIGRYFVSGD